MIKILYETTGSDRKYTLYQIQLLNVFHILLYTLDVQYHISGGVIKLFS